MPDSNSQDILYRPKLELPQNYNTDKLFIDTDDDTLSPPLEQSIVTIPQQVLITQIENLKESLLFIPSAIRPITESILDLVLFLLVLTAHAEDNNDGDDTYEIITPVIKPPITDPDKIEKNEDSQDEDPIDLEDIFKGGHKNKTIFKHVVTEPIKIDYIYSQSTLDISRHYIDKISSILASFNSHLLITPELMNVLDVVYDTPLLNFKNQIAHSILQCLLKSQQGKISKMRLYQKLYNEKESLTLLKSLEYSKLTLLKLTNIDNYPSQPRLLAKHLQTIEAERQKLEKKMFEYYRYLDGSLDALETCLNLHITEGLAKLELNKINEEEKNDSTH